MNEDMKTNFNFFKLIPNQINASIARKYDRYDNAELIDVTYKDQLYYVEAIVNVQGKENKCSFVYDEEYDLFEYQCGCLWCDDDSPCAHIGAVLLKLNELDISSFPFHYVNDKRKELERRREQFRQEQMKMLAIHKANKTKYLIQQNKQFYQHQLDALTLQEKYQITPYFHYEDDAPYIDYKVGNEKKYVIKSISSFLDNIANQEIVKYGKFLSFLHIPEAFDEDALKQIEFMKYVEDVYEKNQRENYFFYGNYHYRIASKLYIQRSVMDSFYDLYKDYEFDNCHLIDCIYRIKVRLVKENNYYIIKLVDKHRFYIGMKYFYFIKKERDNTQIQRLLLDKDYKTYEIINHLLDDDIYIIEEDFNDFYKYVLTPILDCLDIDCHFELYQLSYTLIKVYGDINNLEQICFRVYYEDEDQNRIPAFQDHSHTTVEQDIVENYFRKQCQYIDEKEGLVYFDTNDEKIYEFMHQGIEFLKNYCEIYISDALKKIGKPVYYHIQVGVKIKNDLISLDIESAQIPQMEISQVLAQYRRKKKFYRLKNGELLYLESPQLEELTQLMDEYHLEAKDIHDGELTLNKNRAFTLNENVDKVEYIHMNRLKSFQDMIQKFDETQKNQYQLLPYYQDLLRDYQKEGYQWLRTLHDFGFNGILADDMGLGKTLQIIALLDHLDTNQPSLVVCPSSLIYNWEDEVHKFSSQMEVVCIVGDQNKRLSIIETIQGHQLYVTSYEYMRRDYALYDKIQFEYVVLDESQYIKNQKTQNAISVKKLQASHKLALSGTPIENSLAELWSVFDFLMPQYLYNYHYFRKRYEIEIVKNHNQEIIQQLQKMVSPFILRRNKKDVLLELPDKVEKVLTIPFTQQESELYYANLAQINEQLQNLFQMESIDKIAILSMLTRLRQICCEPRMIYENIYQSSSKMKACMELIYNYKENYQKVLVFSSFTKIFDLMIEELKMNGIRYFLLTGQTTKEKRKEFVDRFQNGEADVFLISLKAGGTGLNLTAAEAVIHFDPWWNISAQNQATDRAYRIGQHKNVQVHQLIMKDSIEEKIQILQAKKKELADMFVENSQGNISLLSKEELKELFAI